MAKQVKVFAVQAFWPELEPRIPQGGKKKKTIHKCHPLTSTSSPCHARMLACTPPHTHYPHEYTNTHHTITNWEKKKKGAKLLYLHFLLIWKLWVALPQAWGHPLPCPPAPWPSPLTLRCWCIQYRHTLCFSSWVILLEKGINPHFGCKINKKKCLGEKSCTLEKQ